MRMYADHPYLVHVTDSVNDIPQRVKAYNNSLFVVWNARTEKFEIHSHENKGSTYCFEVPHKTLDARVIEQIRRTDVRNRGMKIIEEMDESNRRLEEAEERKRKNWIEDVAKETRWHFKKAYDESRGV